MAKKLVAGKRPKDPESAQFAGGVTFCKGEARPALAFARQVRNPTGAGGWAWRPAAGRPGGRQAAVRPQHVRGHGPETRTKKIARTNADEKKPHIAVRLFLYGLADRENWSG
ncbi:MULTISPECIES: hypothetical protein [Cupriavidus]